MEMTYFSPDWMLPSKMEDNPMVLMINVNGLIIDARCAPEDIQQEVFRRGLIPYTFKD